MKKILTALSVALLLLPGASAQAFVLEEIKINVDQVKVLDASLAAHDWPSKIDLNNPGNYECHAVPNTSPQEYDCYYVERDRNGNPIRYIGPKRYRSNDPNNPNIITPSPNGPQGRAAKSGGIDF